jgi:hypothetical protein
MEFLHGGRYEGTNGSLVMDTACMAKWRMAN